MSARPSAHHVQARPVRSASAFLLLLITSLLATACDLAPQAVAQYNGLRIGDPLPKISFWNQHGESIDSSDLHATLFVYVAAPSLPAMCLNEECGAQSAWVTHTGGILVGGADAKFAKSLGSPYQGTPGFAPIVVVADGSKHIVAIYPDAELRDLPRLVELRQGISDSGFGCPCMIRSEAP